MQPTIFSRIFRFFVAAVGVLCPLTAGAQLPLASAELIGTVDAPNALVLADLDRDGDLDAVAASGADASGGDISWWAFDSGTGWGSKNTIDGSFPFAKDLLAADFDRDGDLDIAAVSFSGDELAWWENSAGDGSTWSLKKTLFTDLDGVVALTSGDLDSDGDTDLVVAARGGDAIIWIDNDGTPGSGAGNGGWVARPVNFAAFVEATAVAVGDLDADGDLDVVGAGRSGGAIAWWENDGTPDDGSGGDGNSWTFHSVASGLDQPRAVVVSDLDRDGDLDLAAATLGGDLVWLANASGDAATWAPAASIGSLSGARHLVARDLDSDGDPDLLAAGQGENRVAWYENAVGDASAWAAHSIDTSLSGARGVAVGDIDHDGDLDFAATGLTADSLSWWRNDPIHRRAEFAQVVVADSADSFEAAAAADIDRDGDLDIVGGRSIWITVYERQGTSWLAQDIGDLAGLTGGLVTSVAIGDLDRDGDLDIAGSNGTRVLWWENNGTSAWTRHQVSEGHGAFEDVAIVDLDRDGVPDLFARALSSNEVLWWRNDGTPGDETGGDGNSWTERLIDGDTEFPREALVRDIDRDGDLDVLVFAQFPALSTERVSYWRNDDGLGTSWSRQDIALDISVAGSAADTDGDGDLDVLVGESPGSQPGTLRLIEQSGSGDGTSWEASLSVGGLATGEFFFNKIVTSDFDLDGDADVAVIGDPENTYWFENPSDGVPWLRHDLNPGLFETDGLVAVEASGDGLVDLLASSANDSTIVLWENRSAQAELVASDASPALLEDDLEHAVLRLDARSLGRTGDAEVEIASLRVLLEETPGDPLTGPEAESVLAEMSLYEDLDGSEDFDPLLDSLIGTLSPISPANGLVEFVLADFAAAINFTYRTYFLVAKTTADATAQGIPSLRVTLHTSQSRLEDVTYDTPLALLSPIDTSTALMQFNIVVDPDIFSDGFETGSTANWSTTVN